MRHLEHQIRGVVLDHYLNNHLGHLRHHGEGGNRVIRQPPTFRPVYAAHERSHHITTAGRRALGAELFALPPGPEEVRRGIAGRVPFDTIERARNALQRLGQMRKRGRISPDELTRARRRVLAHWPQIQGEP